MNNGQKFTKISFNGTCSFNCMDELYCRFYYWIKPFFPWFVILLSSKVKKNLLFQTLYRQRVWKRHFSYQNISTLRVIYIYRLNCSFKKIDLGSSGFKTCRLDMTAFSQIILDSIGVTDVKVKSSECNE